MGRSERDLQQMQCWISPKAHKRQSFREVLLQLAAGTHTSRKPSSYLPPQTSTTGLHARAKIISKRSQQRSIWSWEEAWMDLRVIQEGERARHQGQFRLLHLKLQSFRLSPPTPCLGLRSPCGWCGGLSARSESSVSSRFLWRPQCLNVSRLTKTHT